MATSAISLRFPVPFLCCRPRRRLDKSRDEFDGDATFLSFSAAGQRGRRSSRLVHLRPSTTRSRRSSGQRGRRSNCLVRLWSALQLGVFFVGLYIVAFGTGGTKPNISTIGADQFDEFDPQEKMHVLFSFFN
ncbi:hypothetical protein ACP70R_046078 [Stipagrostis hirtigluma subsp. patula]